MGDPADPQMRLIEATRRIIIDEAVRALTSACGIESSLGTTTSGGREVVDAAALRALAEVWGSPSRRRDGHSSGPMADVVPFIPGGLVEWQLAAAILRGASGLLGERRSL